MKVKHTLFALAIVGILAGLLYYLNRQPETPNPDAIPRENLFSFTADQVAEFTLEAPSQPAATFRRLPDEPAPAKPEPAAAPGEGAPQEQSTARWEIAAPEGIAADSSVIQAFLEEAAAMRTTILVGETAPNWSQYGMDAPTRTYHFKLKDGKALKMSIGTQNPGAYAHYVRRDDSQTVLLIDNTDNKSLIEKTLFDLRDKRILPVDMIQASRVELRFSFGGQQISDQELARVRELGLQTRSPRIVFTKQADGNWELAEPHVRTDAGNSSFLLGTLAGGSMKSLEEEKPASLAKYGLDQPEIRIEVTTPSGTQSLLVGKQVTRGEEQSYYAKNSVWPHVFTILRTDFDQLNQDLIGYRERYLFDFETTYATGVEIQGPSGKFGLIRRGEEWFKTGSPEVLMPQVKVDNFVNGIHALRIANYTTDEPGRFAAYGLDNPWMTIKVTRGPDNLEETILFGRKNNKFYGARQGEPSVYELAPNEPENLENKIKELNS